ncbi:MAG: molybdopterin molybdenumtransferase MoeA [Caulobacter sp.]|nr:molybdopterin molybdenumtransferase MoeA [Caulobacter sp.]
MSADPPRKLKGLSVEEARGRVIAAATALKPESVSIEAAAGRVLARDVAATRDQPPFTASAMDGWAVRSADVAAETTLAIVGESAAGHGYLQSLKAGEAVRIFTGAPVPEGSDLVVMQENAVREGDRVRLGPAGPPKDNLRPRGGDFAAGDLLLEAGVRLDPWRLSLAASAGHGSLSVARKPRVAVLATGEELVSPGGDPKPDQIFESGSLGLIEMLRGWGADAWRLEAAGDNIEAIAGAVRGVEADVLITVGGASVGDHDLVKPAFAQLGLELDFETVNVRPGKPTWFGRLGDGRLVLGLPGNPASAFVCAELFGKPLVLALQGMGPLPSPAFARLAEPLPANGPREHYMRAALEAREDGALWVTPYPDQDSSLVTVFARADALVRRLPSAVAAAVGEVVGIVRLARD